MPSSLHSATARWSAWDGSGLEVATLDIVPSGALARGEIAAEPGDRPWATYRIECDAAWRTRIVAVDLADGRRLRLVGDGEGTWSRDGAKAADLQGCIDVDLSGTPFTNTLPIRRLGLGIGARARIQCAYVDLPALAVRPEQQRYTRLTATRYLFESAAHGFARDVDVDEDGLVVTYPGLFRRVG